MASIVPNDLNLQTQETELSAKLYKDKGNCAHKYFHHWKNSDEKDI